MKKYEIILWRRNRVKRRPPKFVWHVSRANRRRGARTGRRQRWLAVVRRRKKRHVITPSSRKKIFSCKSINWPNNKTTSEKWRTIKSHQPRESRSRRVNKTERHGKKYVIIISKKKKRNLWRRNRVKRGPPKCVRWRRSTVRRDKRKKKIILISRITKRGDRGRSPARQLSSCLGWRGRDAAGAVPQRSVAVADECVGRPWGKRRSINGGHAGTRSERKRIKRSGGVVVRESVAGDGNHGQP